MTHDGCRSEETVDYRLLAMKMASRNRIDDFWRVSKIAQIGDPED